MIAVGQKLPNATLYEFLDEASEGCAIGPNAFEVEKLTAGKKVVIFALPGAFTPTCSAKHVPSYVEHFDAIKAKGVPASVSLSAGAFLCNHVFYVAQNKFAGTKIRSGFVHVPLMDSQAPEFPGLPTMPLDQMVTAVRAMLEVL